MVSAEAIEVVERTAMEMVATALDEYLDEAVVIWGKELDKPQDIAEDVTREALDKMGLPSGGGRLYGKVDFKKATWVFSPEATRCALFVDSKAEERAYKVARLQVSQTSLEIRMMRQGSEVLVPGTVPQEVLDGETRLLSVTVVVKYHYVKVESGGYDLKQVTVACVPHGSLQERYNPTPHDGIWRAGPNAPTRDEDFRVRLSFDDLEKKAKWRVRRLRPRG